VGKLYAQPQLYPVLDRHEERVTDKQFYKSLFAPLTRAVGPVDKTTLVALVGFDAGGPLSFCTIGRDQRQEFITYVSCELAIRPEQMPSDDGRFELLASCDDERWARSILTDIGRMSFEVAFGAGHTLDIGPWVGAAHSIQGVVFEQVYSIEVSGERYSILRCLGLTRSELEIAQEHGSAVALSSIKARGAYPHMVVGDGRPGGRTRG
jgi:hypothetical protein